MPDTGIRYAAESEKSSTGFLIKAHRHCPGQERYHGSQRHLGSAEALFRSGKHAGSRDPEIVSQNVANRDPETEKGDLRCASRGLAQIRIRVQNHGDRNHLKQTESHREATGSIGFANRYYEKLLSADCYVKPLCLS